MILPAGTVLQGRYRVEKMLGQGGMSSVYLAQHLRLKKRVALKALQRPQDPREWTAQVEQLELESQIMASLSHPNLAVVFDFFEEQRLPYLVMEFIDGRDLQQVAELAPKLLSQRRVLEFASQIVDALDYLHGQNPPVIVRDLKPSNIMLDSNKRLRLIDFGLARTLQGGQGTRPIVKGVGSLGYAPIEQYGRGTTDQRSDIYALGATLYFLLTDKAPPEAALRLSQKTALVDPATLNDTVTPEVWAAVQKMLQMDPRQRPQSMAEVRSLLGLSLPRPEGPSRRGRQCPACQQPLQQDRRGKVEVDYCGRCKGIWLDAGELEQLVEVSRVYPPPASGQEAQKHTLWEHLVQLLR